MLEKMQARPQKFAKTAGILAILLLSLVASSILTSSLVYGAPTTVTYFVALDGSGNFTDIQSAIEAVPSSAHGMIIVKKGVYELNPTMKFPFKLITVRSNLTIRGEGMDKTIVKTFPTTQPYGSNIRSMSVTSTGDIRNLVIENMTIIQNGTPDNMGWSAIDLRGGTNTDVVIRYVRVADVTGSAIAVPQFRNLTIDGCVVERAYTGINVVGGSKGLLRNNRVLNMSGNGIFPAPLGQLNMSVTDLTIEGNYVEDIGDTGIDVTSIYGAPPHDRIIVAHNYLNKTHIRISYAQNITVSGNTVENGFIAVDAGQTKPTNVTVESNKIITSKNVGIGFYGARDCRAMNNSIYFTGPSTGKAQAGISAGIWGTGLIEGNTVTNSSNYGINFAGWGTGGQSRITIRNNTLLDFRDIGIYDDNVSDGPVVVENNTIWDRRTPLVARYGIRTDYAYNAWTIRYNKVYAGSISPISAPKSKVYDNIYSPPTSNDWPSGDFASNVYVSGGEKAEVVSTRVYSGSYGAKFSSDGLSDREYAYWSTSITAVDDVWCDGYVNVEVSGISESDDRFFFFRLRSENPSSDLAFAGWKNYGGKVLWCISVRDGDGYTVAYSATSPQINRWYHVKIHWVANLTNGYGELYVDETLVATTVNNPSDTAHLGPCSTVWFGLAQLIQCKPTIIYCDEFNTDVQNGSNDWPSGDFASNVYVSGGEKAEVVSTRVYSGSYGAKFSSDGLSDREYAYWSTSITAVDDVWCDGYVNVEVSGISESDDRFFFFRLRSENPSSDLAFAGWKNYGGKVLWCISVRDGDGYTVAYSATSPQINRWYHVKIHWVANLTNGYGELYVDETLVATTVNNPSDTAHLGPCSTVWFGLAQLIQCKPTIIYCDEFNVD
jgi:hypothetical protein